MYRPAYALQIWQAAAGRNHSTVGLCRYKTHQNRLLEAVTAVLKTHWWWLPVRNGFGKLYLSQGYTSRGQMALEDQKVIFQLRTRCLKSTELQLLHPKTHQNVIAESLGWKRPLRSSSPIVHLPPMLPTNHVPIYSIFPFLKHLHGQWLHHLPGQPVTAPDSSYWEEIHPDIQTEPPLVQLEAISSCPIANLCYSYYMAQAHLCSHCSVLTEYSCQDIQVNCKTTFITKTSTLQYNQFLKLCLMHTAIFQCYSSFWAFVPSMYQFFQLFAQYSPSAFLYVTSKSALQRTRKPTTEHPYSLALSTAGDQHYAELQCQCKLRFLPSPSIIHRNKYQHICSSATCYIRATKLLEINHLQLF